MTTDTNVALKRILAEHGYQLTKARIETFGVLLHPEPQSMAELLAKATGKVDRVSVYRNIEVFEKIGLVNRIYIGWKYKLELSDAFVGHHHHMTCLGCNSVINVDDEQHLDEFINKLAADYDFAVRQHQFEIDGYCRACRSRG